jgi:D-glycero-beta-D-manno-heptose-7-phosphate kinase
MSETSTPLPFQSLPWSTPRVCVVGDVMVDAYMWGKVTRISPEAPVPVVEVTRREQRVGGAGNVVKNLTALGAEVDVISVVGDDSAGHELTRLLATMCTPHLAVDPQRPTTVKTRVISGGHHVVRVDEESTAPVPSQVVQEALGRLHALLSSARPPEVVVIEDYDKGLMTLDLIEGVLDACDAANVPVAVDPKLRHFNAYRGVALFKPNLKELNEGLGLQTPVQPQHREAMECAVETLMDRLQCTRLMVTLGEHGTWMHAPSEGVHHAHVPAVPREIMDVSGAGDTVISVAALLLASGTDATSLAAVANLAGGWVCERVGVVPIPRRALESELSRVQLPHSAAH